MLMAGSLADVVQQQREAHQILVFNLLKQAGETSILNRLKGIDRNQRVLIDGVAMIEIPNHKAFDVVPFGQRGGERAALLHPAQSVGSMRQRQQLFPLRPTCYRLKALQTIQRVWRKPQLMPRGENEQAQIRRQLVRLAQQDAVADHAELGGRQARPPLMKTAEKSAGLLRGALHGVAGGPIDLARMAVIVAHHGSRMRTHRLLRVKTQNILIPPGHLVQANANAGQELERVVKCHRNARRHVARMKRGQPANHLQIAQAARRILHIGFQVINRVLILGPARVGEPG